MPASRCSTAPLRQLVDAVFGSPNDPLTLLDERARIFLRSYDSLTWEGDASTFEFHHVSPSAEHMLGYPVHRWTREPTFWTDVVVRPDDRDHAIAYRALASGRGKDHDFIYRARRRNGSTAWLHDFVRVVAGRYRPSAFLRGVMIDVTDEQQDLRNEASFHAVLTFDMLRAEAGHV